MQEQIEVLEEIHRSPLEIILTEYDNLSMDDFKKWLDKERDELLFLEQEYLGRIVKEFHKINLKTNKNSNQINKNKMNKEKVLSFSLENNSKREDGVSVYTLNLSNNKLFRVDTSELLQELNDCFDFKVLQAITLFNGTNQEFSLDNFILSDFYEPSIKLDLIRFQCSDGKKENFSRVMVASNYLNAVLIREYISPYQQQKTIVDIPFKAKVVSEFSETGTLIFTIPNETKITVTLFCSIDIDL